MRYADLDPILSELAREGKIRIDARDIVSIIGGLRIYPSYGIKPEFGHLAKAG